MSTYYSDILIIICFIFTIHFTFNYVFNWSTTLSKITQNRDCLKNPNFPNRALLVMQNLITHTFFDVLRAVFGIVFRKLEGWYVGTIFDFFRPTQSAKISLHAAWRDVFALCVARMFFQKWLLHISPRVFLTQCKKPCAKISITVWVIKFGITLILENSGFEIIAILCNFWSFFDLYSLFYYLLTFYSPI